MYICPPHRVEEEKIFEPYQKVFLRGPSEQGIKTKSKWIITADTHE